MKLRLRTATFVSQLLDQLQPSESVVLGIAALIVGVSAGAGIWAFKLLIELLNGFWFGTVHAGLGGETWTIIFIPILGGVVVGLIMQFIVGPERRHGVPGVIEAVALAGGRLRYWRIPPKTLAAAVSIGSGAAVGPEDPSVQLGAGFGSLFGQWFRLSDKRVRVLVAAGVAAGIAAAFNAPIAGVFFAMEIVLGQIGGNALGVVVLSAVVSAVFTQAVTGPQPAFNVPDYSFGAVIELPFYLVLGLLAGPVAAVYSDFVDRSHSLFKRIELPRWTLPALAGIAVGLAGIFLPDVMGVGYETIERVLEGTSIPILMLTALLVTKLVLTPICIGAGHPGGVFAPSLFLGAVLGGAYGLIIDALFPGIDIVPQAFALVGMAAVLAGSVHAPLTAILLLFEMTNDYRIILPLMFAVAVALYVSQRFSKESIYTRVLRRKGIRIEQGRDIEVMEGVSVGEAMQKSVSTIEETSSVLAASERMARTGMHGLPVLSSDGRLVGVVTLHDIDRAGADALTSDTVVGDICTRDLLLAYPDESLAAALRRMSVRDVGRLPVVDRDDEGKLVGLVRRSDVIRAYDVALGRRADQRHRERKERLTTFTEVYVEDVPLRRGSSVIGRRIREVDWPQKSVIATVRRGQHTLVPDGDTVLKRGDILGIVGDRGAHQTIALLLHPDFRQDAEPVQRVAKSFVYLVRFDRDRPAVLAMESPEEPGYEIPRGKVDAGESPFDAANRELMEESGLGSSTPLRPLASVQWHDEDQHFFAGTAPSPVTDRFEHVVTGDGGDAGTTLRYSWIELDEMASLRLVQGSNRCLGELRRWIDGRKAER